MTDEYSKGLEQVAKLISKMINPEDKKHGFILLVYRDNEPGNTDMVSNLSTDSVKMALKDLLETIDKQ